jgi:hypothetical protein
MARVVLQLTGGILGYSLHIGKFHGQRRPGGRQIIIEVEKKSQIGAGSIWDYGLTLSSKVLSNAFHCGILCARPAFDASFFGEFFVPESTHLEIAPV